jgi:H2-forming N5,N10-methylenetetrahydromethanopterin dehydrogenase-like enzyme
MKKSEIKFNESDTHQSVVLVGLRFMVYTIQQIFNKSGDDRLNWDLNVSTMVTILNRMTPEDQQKVLNMFTDFYTEVQDDQIEEFKNIFLPIYNAVIDKIQPTGIVTLIGDGFDDEVDDHLYLNQIDM